MTTGFTIDDSVSGYSNYEASYYLTGDSAIYQFESDTSSQIINDETNNLSTEFTQDTNFLIDSPRLPVDFRFNQSLFTDLATALGQDGEWSHSFFMGPEFQFLSPLFQRLELDFYVLDNRDNLGASQYTNSTLNMEKRISKRQTVTLAAESLDNLSNNNSERQLMLGWLLYKTTGTLSSRLGQNWIDDGEFIQNNSVGSLIYWQRLNSRLELSLGGQRTIEQGSLEYQFVPGDLLSDGNFYSLDKYWLNLNWTQYKQEWAFQNSISTGAEQQSILETTSHQITLSRSTDIGLRRPLEYQLAWTTIYETSNENFTGSRQELELTLGQRHHRELNIALNTRIIDLNANRYYSFEISFTWAPSGL